MEINPEYVVNSLASQIAELSIKVAQKDAVIAQLNEENEKLKKEIVKEMDAE